jgi:hypothetical protein
MRLSAVCREGKMFRKLCAGLIILTIAVQSPAWSQAQNLAILRLSPVLEGIDSPKNLSKFMRKNFKFVEDRDNFGKVDYWQSPEQMLQLKKGDCEDFALFADAILKELGFESEVISIYGTNQYAHTVAAFKQDGKWRIFNDGKLYKYDTDTLEESVSKVYAEWTWAAFTEKKKSRGWLKKIFYNPSHQSRLSVI